MQSSAGDLIAAALFSPGVVALPQETAKLDEVKAKTTELFGRRGWTQVPDTPVEESALEKRSRRHGSNRRDKGSPDKR